MFVFVHRSTRYRYICLDLSDVILPSDSLWLSRYWNISSSFSKDLVISWGSEEEDYPIVASQQSKALYGDLLIPEWWLLIFSNCTNFNPMFHFVQLFSLIHIVSIFPYVRFPLSARPCDCGCLGLSCTILQSSHMSFTSLMTVAVNSVPLLDWRICWPPINRTVLSTQQLKPNF